MDISTSDELAEEIAQRNMENLDVLYVGGIGAMPNGRNLLQRITADATSLGIRERFG